MEYVPYAPAVDVVLNGEYEGCYQLCDQVEVNKNRVNITEMEPTDIDGEVLTGGYFFEIDAYADQELPNEWFYTPYSYLPVTIKSPDDGGTTEQYDYLRGYLGSLEEKLYSSDFADEEAGYRSILDIDSFLQYFIVGELTGNTDTYWSTYMYKRRGDNTIYTGPVWDFDLAFDNDYRTYPLNKYNTYLYASGTASLANGMRPFVDRIIFDDPKTAGDISRIWSAARNHADLSAESLGDFVDAMAQSLDRSQTLNFKSWPIMNEYVHMNPAVFRSYEAEVKAFKRYLTNRFTKLDKMMNYIAESGVESVAVGMAETKLPVNRGSVIVGDGEREFEVYAMSGARVYAGVSSSPTLAPGVYLARYVNGNVTARYVIR